MDFKHLVLPPTLQMRIPNSKKGTGNIWIKKIGYPNLLPPQPQTSFGSSLGRSYRPYLPPWGRMTGRNLLRVIPCPKDRRAVASSSFRHTRGSSRLQAKPPSSQPLLTPDVFPPTPSHQPSLLLGFSQEEMQRAS